MTRTPSYDYRTAQRILRAAVATFVAAFSVFIAPAAHADVKTITTTPDNEAWYWSSNQDVRACTPDNPTPAPGLCSSQNFSAAGPISPGHLGVSMKAGQSDMRAYMAFPLDFAPIGSQISSMVVTLTVSRADATDTQHTQEHNSDPNGAADSQPKAPATQNDGAAKIDACLVKVPWGPAFGAPPRDRDPNDPTNTEGVPTEPAAKTGGVDMDTCIHGTPVAGTSGTKAWTFDVTPFAQKWISGEVFNNGFALIPKGAAPDTWVVELHGAYYTQATQEPSGATGDQVLVSHKEEAKARVDYVAAVPPPPPPPPSAPPVVTPPDLGGGGIINPPSSAPSISTPTTPPPVIAAAPSVPVSTSKPVTPWYAWMMLPVGLVGFVGLSRALGRESGELAGNHVAEVLRRRRLTDNSGD